MTVKLSAVVITVSDRCARGEQVDQSGPALVELLKEMGAEIIATEVLPDDLERLTDKIADFADWPEVNLILTTGGTGFSPRDNTPEATRAVIEKEAPGLAEAMRLETLKQTPMAMISRGVCGLRNGALIVNLPGSPAGVRQSFAVIQPVLPHAITQLLGQPHEESGVSSPES